ncbi:MAG: hypothetical protein JSR59_10965 [Proteobacteria bacterium]|nr:hypothetical protein [Pseudomonadota bacterium]
MNDSAADDRNANAPALPHVPYDLGATPELARLAVLFRHTLRNAELNPLLYFVQRYRRPEQS